MPLSCRRGAASVIFAIAIIPILGLCGLAVDYGLWARIESNLNMAANSAALNAVKIAAIGEFNNDPNFKAEGQSAGIQWFLAQAGSGNLAYLAGGVPTVSIDVGNKVTAKVTFSGTLNSIFGKLFFVNHYPIGGNAAATLGVAPYTEVILAVDDSSSMDIAATPSDINSQASISGCDASNAFYDTVNNPGDPTTWTDLSNEFYYNYACAYNGVAFDGNSTNPTTGAPNPSVVCPAVAPAGVLGQSAIAFTSEDEENIPQNQRTSASTHQSCLNLGLQKDGKYPIPGPPCGFACHWDNSGPKAGLGKDLWAAARHNHVLLRLDVVKQATQTTLAQMQADNIATLNNLSVGIYTFDTNVTPVYPDPKACTEGPPTCEAGHDFTAASNAVGWAPSTPENPTPNGNLYTDTGIQPVVAQLQGDNNDTAFPEDMNALAKTFTTPSGNGLTAASPQKFLILVTDGFQDDPSTTPYYPGDIQRQAFDPQACQQFKNNGYQVYVVYTPYYPVFHLDYLASNWAAITQGTGPGSIYYNLTACSSQSLNNGNTYIISAADKTDLTNALLTFLKEALNSPARFTE